MPAFLCTCSRPHRDASFYPNSLSFPKSTVHQCSKLSSAIAPLSHSRWHRTRCFLFSDVVSLLHRKPQLEILFDNHDNHYGDDNSIQNMPLVFHMCCGGLGRGECGTWFVCSMPSDAIETKEINKTTIQCTCKIPNNFMCFFSPSVFSRNPLELFVVDDEVWCSTRALDKFVFSWSSSSSARVCRSVRGIS